MNPINSKDHGMQSLALDYLQSAGLISYQIDQIEEFGFYDAPASKEHHLAYAGGLMEHSINVVDNLLKLEAFDSLESAYRVGMLHDLVKCQCYRMNEDGAFEYVQPPYPGHGVASVLMCQELGISLSPEETAAIVWHMGAFGLGEKELKEYHAAIRRFPRAIILTHAADFLASVKEEGGAK